MLTIADHGICQRPDGSRIAPGTLPAAHHLRTDIALAPGSTDAASSGDSHPECSKRLVMRISITTYDCVRQACLQQFGMSSTFTHMAKDLERLREAGTLDSYSADEAVGITLNHLMFRKGITRKQLGEALGITGPAAGRKLRGEIGWSLTDLFIAADFFNIEVTNLLPRRAKEDPALDNQDGIFTIVAGTGFEPVTSGL